MSEQSPNMGIVQWHPNICPHHRWFRMAVQLFNMQRDIRQAQRHTTGMGK